MDEEHRKFVQAVAGAKALMLGPGCSFAIPVNGSKSFAEDCAEVFVDTLEVEYAAGRHLLPDLASPDEIELAVVSMAPERSYILVHRAAIETDE